MNSASLDSLLQRVVKVSHLGPDFVNTFFMTMPLYTDTHTVMGFLLKSYYECVGRKEKGRRASLCPQEAVRGARGEFSIGAWGRLLGEEDRFLTPCLCSPLCQLRRK